MIGEEAVLDAWVWGETPRVHQVRGGLINRTFIVSGQMGPLGVLQRLNTKVFGPEVHEDIEAVTRHLQARGLPTPLLQRTRDDGLWHAHHDGTIWRVLGWVGDRSIERAWSGTETAAAGALVARFHAATADLDWQFRSTRGGFHDTDSRMRQLQEVLSARPDHRLAKRVAPVADAILHAWQLWDGPRDLPLRVVHGDLKTSNVRFQGSKALALIDLDTLGRGTLDAELGDAFRSWCNPALEDESARFDAELFAEGIRGYASEARGVTVAEWEAIVPGIERIALELAARFAADALEESYFGWDADRCPTRGHHNLARAQGQLDLALEVRGARLAAEELVRATRP